MTDKTEKAIQLKKVIVKDVLELFSELGTKWW